MSTHENDVYLEELHQLAQEAMAAGDTEKVESVIARLNDEGFVFAAQALKKEWDDSQEVDV